MVCQKSAMHEKLPPHAYTSTCYQPLSLSVSQWTKLQSEPESCVLPSRETCLMRTDKRLILLGADWCHAPQTDSMGHWAESIRHGSVQKGNHPHRLAVRETIADGLKKTKPQCTTTPMPSKSTMFALPEKNIIFPHHTKAEYLWWPEKMVVSLSA